MRPRRGTGSLYKRGNIFWIKYYANGESIRESSRSDKEVDARKLLKRRIGELAVGRFSGPEADKITVKELSEDLQTDYRANKKKSEADLGWRLKHLLPFLGHLKAQQVGADRVTKCITTRQEEGATNATINRELAALTRMYNLGIASEKIFRKPGIKLLRENNVRTGFFEKGEFVALRAALPDHLKPVVTFAYYTGWRRREILSLKWTQVDVGNKSVRLDPGNTKSGEGRTIFLDGELLDVIREQWEKRKHATIPGQGLVTLSPYVFHHNGYPIRDFRDSWENACKQTGLPGKLFHDFRRTAVRNMVRARISEKVAMGVSGHKTRSVFDRYDIVSEDDLKEAARRISAHVEAQTGSSNVVPMEAAG